MSHMGMPDMPMSSMPRAWAAGPLAVTFAMWTVMMVGMMLPSAAPTILLYTAKARKNGECGTVLPWVSVFTSGYLALLRALAVALVGPVKTRQAPRDGAESESRS